MNITKSVLILSAALLTGFIACNNPTQKKESTTSDANKVEEKDASATLNIDKTISSIIWHGTDPAKTHTGTVAISGGDMKFDKKGNLVGGNITIDMTSITVTDKTDEDKKPKLIAHLKSDAFFAVDSFPTSVFEISNVEQKDGNNYNIKGNLTIRGTTLGIEVPAVVTTNEGVTNVKTSFTIDRTKWGVNYQAKAIAGKLKDNFIENMMELNVDVSSKK